MRWRIILLMSFAVCFLMGTAKPVKAGTLGTRGVWVSCFEYEAAGLKNKTESEFRTNADKLFSNIKSCGCNTVYFHVRSYDDAIYPSETFGYSKYMVKAGTKPAYDPLRILLDSAHKYGLKFHAWMNPYRVTKKKVLNPGEAATTSRILQQVKEIIAKYNVDGIHFDDYFYPSNDKKYNKVSKKTRMKNVNSMVKKVYQTVKAKRSGLQFGISPAGDVSYCEKIGADVKTWLSQSGYVDYVVPQIYWSDQYIMGGKTRALFRERLAKWRSINRRDVPMYIGLALYKAGRNVSGDPGWKNSSSNIANQLNQIRSGNSEGYVLFSYLDLFRGTAGQEMKHYLENIGSLRISKKKKTMRKGKKFQLRAYGWPDRLSWGVRFKSSNKKVASVSKKGLVRAKKKGKARVYAYYGGRKVRCLVRVKKKK